MMATVAFILHPQKPIWNITFPVCHSWAYTFFFNAKLGAILTKKCTSPNALIYPSRCAGVHTYTTIVHKTSFREAFHIFAIFISQYYKDFSLLFRWLHFSTNFRKGWKWGYANATAINPNRSGKGKKAILDYRLNAKMLSPLPHILFSKHQSAKKSQSDIFDWKNSDN